MKDNKDIREELEDLSPLLSSLEKRQNFRVPANYFEQLPEELMARIKQETEVEPTQPTSISWLEQLQETFAALLQPRYALQLAGFALIIIAGVFVFRTMGESAAAKQDGLAALSEEDIHLYISQHIDEYEAEWISEYDTAENSILEEEAVEDAELDIYIDEVIDALDDSDLEDLL